MPRVTTVSNQHVLEFVILHHGFQGCHTDMDHIAVYILQEQEKRKTEKLQRASAGSSCRSLFERENSLGAYSTDSSCSLQNHEIVILNNEKNDGVRCMVGIEKCAERLEDFVVKSVQKKLEERQVQEKMDVSASMSIRGPEKASVGCGGGLPGFSLETHCRLRSTWTLVFHFLGFSMGGLVVRAAAPGIMEKIEAQYGNGDRSFMKQDKRMRKMNAGNDDYQYNVIWKNFFSLSAPQLGARISHPRLKKSYKLVNRMDFFHLTPRVLADLMVHNDLLEKKLLSPRYLNALKAFEKRIFFGVVNDNVVWNYSSCFFLPLTERYVLDGWVPPGPTRVNYEYKLELFTAVVSRELRREKRLSEQERESQSVPLRVSRVITPECTLEITVPDSSSVICKESPPSPLILRDTYNRSWLTFTKEERQVVQDNELLLDTLGLRAATNLEELLLNGITLHQPSTGKEVTSKNRGATLAVQPSLAARYAESDESCNWITEHSWPSTYLPRERNMAISFLQGVGPIELHLVDMMPGTERYLDECMRLAVHRDKVVSADYTADMLMHVYDNVHAKIISSSLSCETLAQRAKRLEKEAAAAAAAASARSSHVDPSPSVPSHANRSAKKGLPPRKAVQDGIRRRVETKKKEVLQAEEREYPKATLPFDFVCRFVAIQISQGVEELCSEGTIGSGEWSIEDSFDMSKRKGRGLSMTSVAGLSASSTSS